SVYNRRRGISGSLVARRSARPRESKFDLYARTREHVHQTLDTEQVDFPAHEVADLRLRDSKELRRRLLRELARLDHALELNHEFSTQPQTMRLLRAESEVAENVSRRSLNFYSHRC